MKFTVKNVDYATIRRLANEYTKDSYVSLKKLSERYGTTPTTISNILWRGIAENIIDKRTAEKIYTKIIDKPSIGWYQRKLRWDEAFQKREAPTKVEEKDLVKEQELTTLHALKDYYENAVASYDSYFFDEDDAPSLEFLQAKLDEVNRKIRAYS